MENSEKERVKEMHEHGGKTIECEEDVDAIEEAEGDSGSSRDKEGSIKFVTQTSFRTSVRMTLIFFDYTLFFISNAICHLKLAVV